MDFIQACGPSKDTSTTQFTYIGTDKEPKPYSTNLCSIMYEDIIVMLFDDYTIMISFWENEKFYF